MPSIPVAKIETFISREESRYMLQFAWFDVEGKRLLATDGHRAMRVSVEPSEAHIHHKRKRSLGRDDRLQNLETLCESCHVKHHHGVGK